MRYRKHFFADIVDEEFADEAYVDTWADSDLLDDALRGRLDNIRRRFFSYDPWNPEIIESPWSGGKKNIFVKTVNCKFV